MEVWLFNNEIKKTTKQQFTIEACYPVNGIYLVTLNENETCVLNNGKDSKPYNAYLIRKIMAVYRGYIVYNEKKHFTTMVDFLNDFGELNVFLLESHSETGHIIFEMDPSMVDMHFTKSMLIDYNEYIEIKTLLSEDNPMTFKEFIKKKIAREGNMALNERYQVPPFTENDFVTARGFNFFLDVQETNDKE